MKGDFSRLTGLEAKRKHYNGVLKQQGRVQLDSDWNELIEIIAHQRQKRTIDTIGNCGAPVHNSGFRIHHSGGGPENLLISSGRFYAGGLLCEANPTSKIQILQFPSAKKIKVKNLKMENEILSENQWIIVYTDETPEGIVCQIISMNTQSKILTLSEKVIDLNGQTNPSLRLLIPYSNQPDFPNAPLWTPVAGQKDLVYLDVWERHISAIEDPAIREIALGGPDTDTRLQTIAQVKVIPDIDSNSQCSDQIAKWIEKTEPGDGRLTTTIEPEVMPDTPCELGESGGYNGLENHLYRVEIHEDGLLGTATFKWSRDNGSVVYSIDEFVPTNSKQIKLKQNGRDEVLKIKVDDWLEISGNTTDLDTERSGTMAKVVKVDSLTLTMDRDVDAHKNESHPKIRKWNVAENQNVALLVTSEEQIKLELGVKISFSGTQFRCGDYWVFEARAVTGEIRKLNDELPYGIKHQYCKLALVTWNSDGTVDIEDCRNEFPPLTELPKTGLGCCTVTVGDHADFTNIQDAVDALNGGPGTVCIMPGVYTLDKPIVIQGYDITIKGCSGKSLILNLSDSRQTGSIFEIQESWGVTITNLWMASAVGDRAVVSIQSHYVEISDCFVLAMGSSDTSGTIVFQGFSISNEVRDCLIAGIVGIRYEPNAQSLINLNVMVEIENNIIFAIQSAILQLNDSTFLVSNVNDNFLLGISINSLMKVFIPPEFIAYAGKYKIYNRAQIKAAEDVNRETGSISAISKSNTAPIFMFANHLKVEASTVKALAESPSSEIMVPTTSPVVDLKTGALDANIQNNLIFGITGIFAATLMESLIDDNIIVTSEHGLLLNNYEGVSVNNNIIYAGLCGILSQGNLSMNLSIKNNRIFGGKYGIQFQQPDDYPYNFLINVQLRGNFINTSETGIDIDNPGIFLYDFIVEDNSIVGCETVGIILNGMDENLYLTEDQMAFQRQINGNFCQVKGCGIEIGVSDTRILDNEINISYENQNQINLSFGVRILAGNCTIMDNSIQAFYDEKNNRSLGGVFIDTYNQEHDLHLPGIIILKDNQIKGGMGNGIEINSDITNLKIEGNIITQCGLNGIAVAESVMYTNNVLIANNSIVDCGKLSNAIAYWWKYAAIVLRNGINIQILGNDIRSNGKEMIETGSFIGGIYAEIVEDITIADNHLIDNGLQDDKFSFNQAVMQIKPVNLTGIENVKIINNIIKGSRAPALILGREFCAWTICFVRCKKSIITGNHFESKISGPAVELQSHLCTFANNFIMCPDSVTPGGAIVESVDLGYGWYVNAISNVSSAPITGAGASQDIDHNQIF